MPSNKLYHHLSLHLGDDFDTIERLGFELHAPSFITDRKEAKRLRRLKIKRETRHNRNLARIANNLAEA